MFLKDGLRYFQSEDVLPNDEELGQFQNQVSDAVPCTMYKMVQII